MNNYKKPVVLLNEELAEGVYAASGAVSGGGLGGDDCWEVKARFHQWPETGRMTYKIQTDAKHINQDHHTSNIRITYIFDHTVTFVSCNGGTLYGSGTGTSITIERNIGTKNGNENLGLGDVEVKTEADSLTLVGVSWVCTGKGMY